MHTESAARAFTDSASPRVVVERERTSVSGLGIVAGIVLSYVLFGLALFVIWRVLQVVLAIIF
jgi:hypothetical protein